MDPSDKERFLVVLWKAADFFRVELGEGAVQGYTHALQHHRLADIEAAFADCMGDHRFMPKAIEIKERIAVLDSRRPPAGPALPPGEVARDPVTIPKWLQAQEPETIEGSQRDMGDPPQSAEEWVEDNPSPFYWDATISASERNRRFYAWRAARAMTHPGTKPLSWEKFKDEYEKKRAARAFAPERRNDPRRIGAKDLPDDFEGSIPF